jgi:adenosylhomocysteinase
MAAKVKHHVRDLKLAADGLRRIEWAEQDMPVLRAIRERFSREKPLKGVRLAGCLHVTTETANLMRALQAGGAEMRLCASNPLSTQDDVAAALVKEFGISTFSIKGEDRKTYYAHIDAALDFRPNITMDDGADLVSRIHGDRRNLAPGVWGGTEETTTGVIRLRALAEEGKLLFPVVAVNDAGTKHLFDNRYGTGQSTVDGIIRATNRLFAGRTVVTAGYGWCGRGFAMRARGMGAQVVVTEIDHLKALEAVMDGFQVMPMAKAARIGDIFCTLTGDINVLRAEHFRVMKDGAVVANSGHFNVEIDIPGLEKSAKKVRRGIRPFVDEFVMKSGHRVYLLADGRLINLAAAEGHPACVMDMSFAVQALSAEFVAKSARRGKMARRVYDVPVEIDKFVAALKLKSMGVGIDRLTPEQEKYLASWEMGT